MLVKFKKLIPEATIPTKAHPNDAGFDMTAVKCEYYNGILTCYTGIAVEIPPGYVGLLAPRSSIYKTGNALCNSVGIIDSGYLGEIMLKFYTISSSRTTYKDGDRVGQLIIMPIPEIEFVETNEFTETERGANGFGSTGK